MLARCYAIAGWTGVAQVEKQLWAISEQLTPSQRVADYTQAIMDLGATICLRSRPHCALCPLASDCKAYLNHSVALYPSPKPSKRLPVKTLVFLVLVNQNLQVLLTKRPPLGIWGGLWSVLEFETFDEALRWCQARQINITKQQPLPCLRHTFSHYHLDYTPLVLHTDTLINQVQAGDTQSWHELNSALHLALAAPIKTLLQHTLSNEV